MHRSVFLHVVALCHHHCVMAKIWSVGYSYLSRKQKLENIIHILVVTWNQTAAVHFMLFSDLWLVFHNQICAVQHQCKWTHLLHHKFCLSQLTPLSCCLMPLLQLWDFGLMFPITSQGLLSLASSHLHHSSILLTGLLPGLPMGSALVASLLPGLQRSFFRTSGLAYLLILWVLQLSGFACVLC